jgi:ribosomal-protein-alanine N-acetyltransferase
MLPTIYTDRLCLRQLEEKDAPQIFIIRSDPDILKYIDIKKAESIEDALAFMKMINEGIAKNGLTYWGIALKDTDELIGTICIWNVNKDHFRAEIGFALLTKFQGKGYMSESIPAIVDHAFEQMKLHSLEGRVNPLNASSIKVMERNGFVKEAHFKEDYYCEGVFLDTAVYSKVRGKT